MGFRLRGGVLLLSRKLEGSEIARLKRKRLFYFAHFDVYNGQQFVDIVSKRPTKEEVIYAAARTILDKILGIEVFMWITHEEYWAYWD